MDYQIILFFVVSGLVALGAIVTIYKSIHIIEENENAIVSRLGRFRRILKPGMNFTAPFVDRIVFKEGLQERVLDIPPQPVITKDNVAIEVDAIIYWEIFDVYRVYYDVDDLFDSLGNVVKTMLRSMIGNLKLQDTYSSRDQINTDIIGKLSTITSKWGVRVTLVEIQNIEVSDRIKEGLEQEREAESRKRATLANVEAISASVEALLKVIEKSPQQGEAILRFILAQKYMEVNENISKSENAKIIFMDPKALTESIASLMAEEIPTVDS
ncbi:MAG: stomatin-like protein [Limnothrix sp.]